MSKQVYIITGVPGVGKTSVAKSLADMIRGSHIDLSAFSSEQGLITGRDEYRDTLTIDLKEIRKRLGRFIAASDGPLVIEGHFASAVVAGDMPDFVFVLRKAPWILKRELEERGYSEDKVRENVEAEMIGVCLTDALEAFEKGKVCEINTTDRSVDEVVREIISTVKGERPCIRGEVDWLDVRDPNWLLEV